MRDLLVWAIGAFYQVVDKSKESPSRNSIIDHLGKLMALILPYTAELVKHRRNAQVVGADVPTGATK